MDDGLFFLRSRGNSRAARLSRMADRIVDKILHREPRIDVDIAIARLRDQCEAWFPDKMGLFEMVYESRFERLREQFGKEKRPDSNGRSEDDDPWGLWAGTDW